MAKKRKVMAFTAKEVFVSGKAPTTSGTPVGNELTPPELEYLLTTLKNTDLKGFQVELFYNLVVKLQNQYLQKTNK